MPNDATTYLKVAIYKQLEPVLFNPEHQTLKQVVDQVEEQRNLIRTENRRPFGLESQIISNYNTQRMSQVDKLADKLHEAKIIRKMTTLEKSRVALLFVNMHEKPQDFMQLNKFLERSQSIAQLMDSINNKESLQKKQLDMI